MMDFILVHKLCAAVLQLRAPVLQLRAEQKRKRGNLKLNMSLSVIVPALALHADAALHADHELKKSAVAVFATAFLHHITVEEEKEENLAKEYYVGVHVGVQVGVLLASARRTTRATTTRR